MKSKKTLRFVLVSLAIWSFFETGIVKPQAQSGDLIGGASSDIIGGASFFSFTAQRARRVGQTPKRSSAQNSNLCRAANCRRPVPTAPQTGLNAQAAKFLQNAIAFAKKGENEKAAAAYLKSIRLKANAEAFYGLGEVYSEQKKADDAIKNYEKAIVLNPNFDDAYYSLGVAQYGRKTYPNALANLNKAIALGSPEAPEYLYLGMTLRGLKRNNEAIAAFRQAVKIDGKFVAAYESLGDISYEQQNYNDAIGFYQKLIELSPAAKKDADILIRLGYANLLVKHSAKAIDFFTQATKADPKSDAAWLGLGSSYILGAPPDFPLAVKALNQAGELNTQDKDIYFSLACALVNSSPLDAKALVQTSKKVLELEPQSPDAQMFLGVGLMNQRLYQPALAAFKEAIRLDPNNSGYRAQTCGAYGALKKYKEALPECQAAVQSAAPDLKPATRLMLANIYNGLKKHKEAVAECQTVIRENPEFPEAHFTLGTIYASMKKSKDAIAAFNQAINLRPDFGFAHLVLGQFYWDLGKKDEALRKYATLQSVNPSLAAELNLYITTHKK